MMDAELKSLFDRWGNARKSLGSGNCPGCGRFAKVTGYRNYYNGWFDCCTMNLNCSKCGPVEVELV